MIVKMFHDQNLEGISWTPAEAAAYASLTRPFPSRIYIVAGYTRKACLPSALNFWSSGIFVSSTSGLSDYSH